MDCTDLSVPPNKGERIGPRVPFKDGMDGDQGLPALGASTSIVTIGSTGHGNLPASKCS